MNGSMAFQACPCASFGGDCLTWLREASCPVAFHREREREPHEEWRFQGRRSPHSRKRCEASYSSTSLAQKRSKKVIQKGAKWFTLCCRLWGDSIQKWHTNTPQNASMYSVPKWCLQGSFPRCIPCSQAGPFFAARPRRSAQLDQLDPNKPSQLSQSTTAHPAIREVAGGRYQHGAKYAKYLALPDALERDLFCPNADVESLEKTHETSQLATLSDQPVLGVGGVYYPITARSKLKKATFGCFCQLLLILSEPGSPYWALAYCYECWLR